MTNLEHEYPAQKDLEQSWQCRDCAYYPEWVQNGSRYPC